MELTGSLHHMLHRAAQAGDQIFASEGQALGLTARQFAVLQAISRNPGSTQAAIVAATGIDRSTLSDLVSRLQVRGLLSRERSQVDARSHTLRLTAEGESTLEVARAAASNADRRLTEILGEADAAALLGFLTRLSARAQPTESVGDSTDT